jgi:hypothetical protein
VDLEVLGHGAIVAPQTPHPKNNGPPKRAVAASRRRVSR